MNGLLMKRREVMCSSQQLRDEVQFSKDRKKMASKQQQVV